jgi:hypothetical protein
MQTRPDLIRILVVAALVAMCPLAGAVEPAIVQFNNVDLLVEESAGNATLTVARRGSSAGAGSINYSIRAGTATSSIDYSAVFGVLNWADGDAASKTVLVPILDDFSSENSETFTVSLSDPTGSVVLGKFGSSALVTIRDDDRTIRFGATAYGVGESEAFASIIVKRFDSTLGEVSVRYRTAFQNVTIAGSAKSAEDYTVTNGTLTWASGNGADKTITIPIINDDAIEGDETLRIFLRDATTNVDMEYTVLTIAGNDGGGDWTSVDIGTVADAGSATEDAGVFQVNGSGNSIGGRRDSCEFLYQNMTGTGMVSV